MGVNSGSNVISSVNINQTNRDGAFEKMVFISNRF